MFVALKFVTLLDFSGQDFIFETLMGGYSRRLDFLELNPLVDLRRITKVITVIFSEFSCKIAFTKITS